MNKELFESLLYESETETLDFKSEQYLFEGASVDDKAELIKDVLGMANAWRRGPAFILIGVKETKFPPAQVVGVEQPLPASNLQQLVSTKTNRPVGFRYEKFEYDGKQIGVIEIDLQERPVYLTTKFGPLEAQKVYV